METFNFKSMSAGPSHKRIHDITFTFKSYLHEIFQSGPFILLSFDDNRSWTYQSLSARTIRDGQINGQDTSYYWWVHGVRLHSDPPPMTCSDWTSDASQSCPTFWLWMQLFEPRVLRCFLRLNSRSASFIMLFGSSFYHPFSIFKDMEYVSGKILNSIISAASCYSWKVFFVLKELCLLQCIFFEGSSEWPRKKAIQWKKRNNIEDKYYHVSWNRLY